ncbi:MAG: c-type heme family protein [Flammeovirgaceae bacterium]
MRIIYFLSLQTVLFFTLLACSQSAEKESEVIVNANINQELLAEGLQIMKTQCFACHSPEATGNNRIAPPFHAIKQHYMQDGMKYPPFHAAMKLFLSNPSEKQAKMRHAVERFGLMPKMSLTDAQVKAVTTYLYHTDIEKSGWHLSGKPGAEMSKDKSYKEQGMEYAMATKAVLGKNLMTALKAKGTAGALAFCNERALPLTDSMQQHLGVDIKRVSDNNRNPSNQANKEELAYIKTQKQRINEGKKPEPLLVEGTKEVVGYYPIMTNQMCLQCHGKANETLKATTLSKINELYPKDKAIGYDVNQLRGIWVVKMPKSLKRD